jgi:hypothetical protein
MGGALGSRPSISPVLSVTLGIQGELECRMVNSAQVGWSSEVFWYSKIPGNA